MINLILNRSNTPVLTTSSVTLRTFLQDTYENFCAALTGTASGVPQGLRPAAASRSTCIASLSNVPTFSFMYRLSHSIKGSFDL